MSGVGLHNISALIGGEFFSSALRKKIDSVGLYTISALIGCNFSSSALKQNIDGVGLYTISALIGGDHIAGSPAEVEASTAQAHAPHCEVVGAPITLRIAAGAERLSTLPQSAPRLCFTCLLEDFRETKLPSTKLPFTS